jgi:hypothetical protein
MPANLSRLCRVACLVALGGIVSPTQADDFAANETASVIAAAQTPADFLDAVSLHTKARWRLLFRPPPPTPPIDRNRAALILGTLLGDSFLVLQATDAQQFRNNNQDVLAYCRTLGLGEKLLPRLMTQGNLAEQNAWKDLRQELVDGHQEALRLLREQKDEDLALLIDIGVGLRLLEIVANIIVAAPESDMRPLSSGTPSLLQELRDDFSRIGAERREHTLLQRVRATIDETRLGWQNVDKTPISQAQAVKTSAKLKELMQEMIAR